MLTLSYGYKKPQTSDRGDVFFPALEQDIQAVNDHIHDGVTSAPISVTNLTKSTQAISAGSWVPTSGGHFRQEVTLPAGFLFSSTMMRFIINGGGSDGEIVIPTVNKGTAANKYYVFINDNSIALTALYV